MKKTVDRYATLDELKKFHQRWQDYEIRLFDRLSDITVVAPHGGHIESGTSLIARLIAAHDLNLYDFRGLLTQDPALLHVTSSRFDDGMLYGLLHRSRLALSVHSMGVDGSGEIWVGGRNRELVDKITAGLCEAGFVARSDIPRYRGLHPKNFVNAPREHGVQIEISGDVLASLFATAERFADDESLLHPNTRLHALVAVCRAALGRK